MSRRDRESVHPNATGPDRAAGDMGVSSEREGPTGSGQHATDGTRPTAPRDEDDDPDTPPEQQPGNPEGFRVGIEPKAGYSVPGPPHRLSIPVGATVPAPASTRESETTAGRRLARLPGSRRLLRNLLNRRWFTGSVRARRRRAHPPHGGQVRCGGGRASRTPAVTACHRGFRCLRASTEVGTVQVRGGLLRNLLNRRWSPVVEVRGRPRPSLETPAPRQGRNHRRSPPCPHFRGFETVAAQPPQPTVVTGG